ncbi:hypothetical protein ACRS6B_26545 [Nocardia asteroides]
MDEGRYEYADTIYTTDVEVHAPRIHVRGIDKVVDYMRQAEVEGQHTQHTNTDLLVTSTATGPRPRRTRWCTSTATAARPTRPAVCAWPARQGGRRRAGASARRGSSSPGHARIDLFRQRRISRRGPRCDRRSTTCGTCRRRRRVHRCGRRRSHAAPG